MLATLLALSLLPAATSGKLERRLYVSDKTGVSIYDIDHGHKLLRRIDLPGTGAYKGIGASVPLGLLYLTSNVADDLLAVDLATEKVVWSKNLGKYADSFFLTPDGQKLWVPYRDEICWRVVRASDGSVLAEIPTERGKNYDKDPIGSIGPHNTWINPAGTRAYLEVLTIPYIYVADTATNKITTKIGPFSKGIRPFCLTDDEKYLFASVDGLLGFEVASIPERKMLYRVEAKTPPERLKQIPNPPAHKPHSTPSHGINLRPDQKEVWIVDGVYGYVYAYDVTVMPPKYVAGVPLYAKPEEQPHPGWISFSIDGRYAYPDGGAVIDTRTKKVVARIPTSEKLVEIDFVDGKPAKSGHR